MAESPTPGEPTPGAPTPGILRAREELAAAELLAVHGLPAPAVAAAVRSALAAADDALVLLGRPAGAAPGTVSLFVRYVVGQRGLDARTGQRLRALVNRGRRVEHVPGAVPASVAAAAVSDAREVLDAVEDWVAASLRVAAERARVVAATATAGNGGPSPSGRPARRRR